MSVQSAAVTVAATPTLLAQPASPTVSRGGSRDGIGVSVSVPSGGVTVYLGGADVSTSNGFPVAAGSSLSVDLAPGDLLYGVVASSTQAVRVLKVEV